MKLRLYSFIVLLAAAAGCGVFPPSAPPRLAAARTAEPVTPDGVAAEEVWSRAQPYPLLPPRDRNGGTGCRQPGTGRVAYDDRFLYVLAELDDDDVVQEEEVGRVALELLLRHDAAGHAQVRLIAPQVAQQRQTEQRGRESRGLRGRVNKRRGAVRKERQGALQSALLQVPEEVVGLVGAFQGGVECVQEEVLVVLRQPPGDGVPVKALAAAAGKLHAEELAEKRGVGVVFDGAILADALRECVIGLLLRDRNGLYGCCGLTNDSGNSLAHRDARERILCVNMGIGVYRTVRSTQWRREVLRRV